MIGANKWGSVRKVRYLEDIESAVEYALENKGAPFSENTFTSKLIKRRQERYNLVRKHYRTSILRTKRSMYQTRFGITLPDTLKFLKESKVFEVRAGIVEPLALANILQKVKEDQRKRLLILEYVLKSKYKAYEFFLEHLALLGHFVVPQESQKRDKEFGKRLEEAGFLTDVASFYTMRDLFYELDVINWYVDDKDNLTIYPTFQINGKNTADWEDHVQAQKTLINLRRKLDINSFISTLVEFYLKLTGRRFMVNADLIRLRDLVCKEYGLGDFYFKEILLGYIKKEKRRYKILLSFGSIMKRKRNYDLKVTSLPLLTSNRLALYIAIEEMSLWQNGLSTV